MLDGNGQAGGAAVPVWAMTQGCARMAGMDRAIIEASGLFNRSWYGTAYRAMLGPDADPLEHFLETGAARDCRPNPLFDVAYYRRQAAALRAGDNPLVHYIVTGSGLNLNPSSVFDSVWYRKHGSFGAQKSPQTLLGHFLHVGRYCGLRPNAFYDDGYYRSAYPDVVAAGCDPLYHFEMWGEAEGRHPAEGIAPASLQALADAEGITGDAGRRIAQLVARRPGTSFADLAAAATETQTQRLDRMRTSEGTDRSAILVIGHALGGGVRRFIDERIAVLVEDRDVLALAAAPGGFVLQYRTVAQTLDLFIPAVETGRLHDIIKDINLCAAEIHHTHGFKDLESLIEGLDIPIDLYLHDYYLVSPQPHLLGPDSRFVGDDLELHHAELERAAIVPGPLTVRSWQRSQRWLFERARQVIAPAHDVRRRIRTIYPELEISVIPHERDTLLKDSRARTPRVRARPGRPMTVALLGYLQTHKGIDVARAVFDLARRRGLDLTFVIIGYCDDVRELGPNVRVTGRYADRDLESILVDEAPDLVWYPAQCPETWSYTLTAALRLNLPVLCSDIGAFAERIAGVEHGRTFPWDAAPVAWLTCMVDQLSGLARDPGGRAADWDHARC
ncbi:glycosyltransferase involved in cell wall biosynthesis [Methylobacterium sp. OAE515]|uniref:glycosyltransferase n=1 Tax=Methylobacterium sp. OAE515 TaxID=2817895 RepID=UPI00178ADECA